mmetsp:Transcript_44328/g.130772  ORF Transcript_44328/g.130772 Transcript_44328/m.130772 type:complete len:203 (-) Transcript_44328:767-1375(-)
MSVRRRKSESHPSYPRPYPTGCRSESTITSPSRPTGSKPDARSARPTTPHERSAAKPFAERWNASYAAVGSMCAPLASPHRFFHSCMWKKAPCLQRPPSAVIAGASTTRCAKKRPSSMMSDWWRPPPRGPPLALRCGAHMRNSCGIHWPQPSCVTSKASRLPAASWTPLSSRSHAGALAWRRASMSTGRSERSHIHRAPFST